MSNLIQTNVPLVNKSWFKTGGNAKFFVQPTNALEFQESLRFAETQNLPIFMLGEGANILISDEGFDGLVINPALNLITIENETDEFAFIKSGAGVNMQELIDWSLQHNFVGLEEFSGIPGSV